MNKVNWDRVLICVRAFGEDFCDFTDTKMTTVGDDERKVTFLADGEECEIHLQDVGEGLVMVNHSRRVDVVNGTDSDIGQAIHEV